MTPTFRSIICLFGLSSFPLPQLVQNSASSTTDKAFLSAFKTQSLCGWDNLIHTPDAAKTGQAFYSLCLTGNNVQVVSDNMEVTFMCSGGTSPLTPVIYDEDGNESNGIILNFKCEIPTGQPPPVLDLSAPPTPTPTPP